MIGSGYERKSDTSGESGGKVRVYEIGKELGLSNQDIVSKIRTLGIEVANHMSWLDVTDADRVRRSMDRERQQTLVEERLSATVIRRRSNRIVVAPAPAPAPAVEKVVTAPTPAAAPIIEAKAPAPVPSAEPQEALEERAPSKANRASKSEVAEKVEPPAVVEAPAAVAPVMTQSVVPPLVETAPAPVLEDPVAEAPAPSIEVAAAVGPTAEAKVSEPEASPSVATSPAVTVTPAPINQAPAAETPRAPPTAGRPNPLASSWAATAAASPAARTPGAPPTYPVRTERRTEVIMRPSNLSNNGGPPVLIRQIPQPVVTGSAATGAFIQLPNMPPRGEGGVRIEIKDRDEELRRLGRLPMTARPPTPSNRFGARPGFPPGGGGGFPGGGRPGGGGPGGGFGFPPKKKIVAAGKKIKKTEITTPAEHKRVVRMEDTIQVAELAQKMAVKGKEIIKKLWALGMMGVNINQAIDLDTATLVATEFGFQIESTTFREDSVLGAPETEDNPEDLAPRAPVVTIMGHVDHGKTSLLDAIRKANVAGGEAGGITQHIGAYKVHSDRGDVVFLDTPGHEAFTAMRARGAQMTDIVVLVVAADDGPMPQTIEAVNHAREARVPILVAVNKIDKPGANPDMIRNKLNEHGLVAEEWGGDTIFCNVSAKTKQGVDKLLEMLAIQAEVLELKANPKKPAKGHVVEARLDRSRGSIATLLVEQGTLKIGDLIVAGEIAGKVRAMLNDKGQNLSEAGPSTPVEVLGLDGVPEAGEVFNCVTDEKAAKSLVENRRDLRRKKESPNGARLSLENILDKIKAGEVRSVKVVLKADVQGSAEAIANALTNLTTPSVSVNVISSGVGGITESDISLAKASSAVVIGFNVRPAGKSQQLAEQEGVDIKLYQVIYDAIDDVKKAMVGMLEPVMREKVQGRAEVRQVFTIPKAGTIGGSFVLDGKITRKSQVRLIRDSIVVFTGKVGSLRRFKDDASEVAAGYECGIGIEGYADLKENDIIEAFEIESIAATLDAPSIASPKNQRQ